MQMRTQLEALIEEMLDGQILLDEAVAEFEKTLHRKGPRPPQETPNKYCQSPRYSPKYTLKTRHGLPKRAHRSVDASRQARRPTNCSFSYIPCRPLVDNDSGRDIILSTHPQRVLKVELGTALKPS